jgi:uncharacterized membrane protein YebE (DUF533 family)
MDTKQILIITFVLAYLAFRLYQKYYKKDKGNSDSISKPKDSSSFPSSLKDDKYEPYSKK